MPKSDSEAMVSERHSSLDKNKEENRQRETERCQRGWFTISIKYTKPQSLQCMRECSEALIVSFAIGFPSTNPIPPKQQNSGVPILISKSRHQYLHEGWVLMISKRMNNESHIRIPLSNLAALLARANVLVLFYQKNTTRDVSFPNIAKWIYFFKKNTIYKRRHYF
jgi:hypothetical protein